MAERNESEERVDLDEEFMEEEEEVEEQVESDGEEGAEEENSEEEEVEESESEGSAQEEVQGQKAAGNVEDRDKSKASSGGPDSEKHAQLLELPPHGSQVFIGGLPKYASEADLTDRCQSIGEISEIRLVKNKDTGESKGYAFVSFTTKEAAQKAIEDLHNKQFKGKTIRCTLSESKNRLFIGNIPKSLTEDDFRKVIEETGPGSENIELKKDPQNLSRNRGFAFVEYYNHACADYSREKMSSANFKLEGNSPTVTWADPKNLSDHSAAASAQVKALYVKNIPDNTTTEQVKELFQRHGEITKVVMPPSKSGSGKRDFGFIHFAERSSALRAVKDAEKYEINGQMLEVALAKPQTEKKSDGIHPHGTALNPSYLPVPAYGGFPANPYGTSVSGYGISGGFQQPMIYGRGPMATGMQMVPMVLPDGQIGYVLQQPGMQMPTAPRPRRHDRSSASSGPQGRGGSSGGNDDGNRTRRYRPY